jgi:hypothetical protein
MVDQTTVQAKVSYGYSIAAAKIGQSVSWYRPSGTGPVLVPDNLQGTLQVLFDTSPGLTQKTPRVRAKPEDWYGAFSPAVGGVLIGDYFVTLAPETYFVATMDPLRPSRLVLCNDVAILSRPVAPTQVGYSQAYGGDNRANETPLASGWPCAIEEGMKGETGDSRLPDDVKLPWQTILLPAILGVDLRNDDILTDQNQGRHVLSQVELTKLGWRALAITETG